MKKNEIETNGIYAVRVSGQIAAVRIEGPSPYGGWYGRNVRTGREIRIRTAAKLRGKLTDEQVARLASRKTA